MGFTHIRFPPESQIECAHKNTKFVLPRPEKNCRKIFSLGSCRYENPPVLAFPLQAQKHDSQPAKAYGCPRYNVSKPLHGGKRQKIDAGPSQNYRG